MAISPQVIFYIIISVCAVSVLLTLILTAWLFYKYISNWTQPRTQTLVMRVVILVPTWAILALINVASPDLSYIVIIFFDLMEAFAILSFMQLIYHYLGGKDQAQWKASTKHPYRCLGFMCMMFPGEKFMKVIFPN